jgi:hypothetical protein
VRGTIAKATPNRDAPIAHRSRKRLMYGDRSIKFAMISIVAIGLINLGIPSFRRAKPRPDRQIQAQP